MKSIFPILVSLLLLAAGCSDKKESTFADKIKLKNLDGEPIDLSQLHGKVVFINVWATWCKPCIQEMPSIKSAEEIIQGGDRKEIEFLFASNEGKERIESFSQKANMNLHFVRLENLEELNINILPTTYIINKKGELVFSEAGYRKWDEAENIELLTKLVEEGD